MAVRKNKNASAPAVETSAPVAVPATTTSEKINKADAIRSYFDANPDAKPNDIAAALTKEHGIEFGSAHVSSVLSRHRNGGANANSNGKIDPELIKSAATFVAAHGDVAKALEALDQVGEFIDACGNSRNARAALETFQSLAAVFAAK